MDRFIAKLLRERGESMEVEPASAELTRVAAEIRPKLEPRLRLPASREYGLRVIVERAYKELGLHKAVAALAESHRVKFDFERVVFGMVLNRLVDPGSERACNEWLKADAWFPEGEDWTIDTFYKALDIPGEQSEELESSVTRRLRPRLSDEDLSLLLIDTTSTYFESDDDDRERAEVAEQWEKFAQGAGPEPVLPALQVVDDPPLRLRGHGRDERGDQPRVVLATVATADGRVVRRRTLACNRQDGTIPTEMPSAAAAVSRRGRPVFVLDSGMASARNPGAIDALETGPDRVGSVPMRNNRTAEKLPGRAGRRAQHPDKPHSVARAGCAAGCSRPTDQAPPRAPGPDRRRRHVPAAGTRAHRPRALRGRRDGGALDAVPPGGGGKPAATIARSAFADRAMSGCGRCTTGLHAASEPG